MHICIVVNDRGFFTSIVYIYKFNKLLHDNILKLV
jgi:hypothetical protein